MVATATRVASMTGARAALLAALDREDRRDRERRERDDARKERDRLTARLHAWGDYQREGYDLPGIDYARPRVVGNAPRSTPPAAEWYLSLCATIAALPEADERAIRRVYIYGDSHPRHPAVFELLLALEMESHE